MNNAAVNKVDQVPELTEFIVQTHIKHVTGDMAQAIECLPRKCKALSSNPCTAKK
jgi:hypothetical protein